MAEDAAQPKRGIHKGREFLGITFRCCGVYQRIHRNAAGTAYVGWCPKCALRVEVQISPGGTDDRFFEAY